MAADRAAVDGVGLSAVIVDARSFMTVGEVDKGIFPDDGGVFRMTVWDRLFSWCTFFDRC